MKFDTGDTAWMLASAALVLFMTPGLAMFYGGMVRGKNVLATIMQSFFCMALVSVLWFVIGYSLAFGPSKGGIIGGLDYAFLRDLATPWGKDLTIPPMVFMVYQLMFAIITPALITGSFAERMKFSAFFLFIALWSILVYSPVAHWVFSPEGWLFKQGALDFAGGTVVHVNAGVAGLMTAIVLGRRKGWPEQAVHPHNLTMTLLGAGILWFGWFGFNGGSALGASPLAASAFTVTHMAAAAGALFWVIAEWIKDGKPTTLGIASGAVAGLVAITPASGYVGTAAAIGIGLAAGVVCYLAVGLKFRFRYDDSLDVVGVHLVGGMLGALATGFFALKAINPAGGADGLVAGEPVLVLKQILGIAATLVYSGAVTFVLLKIVDKVIGLRVDEEAEETGLDLAEHSEVGYSFVDLGGRITGSSAGGFTVASSGASAGGGGLTRSDSGSKEG